MVKLSLIIYCLSVAKKREPEDKRLCIAVHNSIHDVDTLDNLSNITQLSEHCLT